MASMVLAGGGFYWKLSNPRTMPFFLLENFDTIEVQLSHTTDENEQK